ncbi:MAG TPA: carbohydrate ABC transporter permease [Roseiarcus sp.]|jgi:ABC-type glycerol-3-phosphate transport system permease component|nr:carbohydrate ABC transporter permease [Roseiarcus sp.]
MTDSTLNGELEYREAASATQGPGADDRNRGSVVGHLVINLFNIIIILPLVWVLLMSVKSLPDAMQGNFWPKRFDFTHYSYVFQRIATLPHNLFNSIYVTFATVLITTVIAVLAGYALVHIRPKGAGVILAILFVSLYFPVRVVSLISIYETQHWLGLINQTAGLILPYVTLQLVISILIMRSMFQLVPHEIIESAKIDGAGHVRTLWEVGLPMVRNGLVVIFIVNFVAAWGEYLLGVTLIDDEAKRTMPVVLAAAQGGQGQWAWPNLAAVYVIVVTPGIVAFTLAQKLFFKGLLEGALKG